MYLGQLEALVTYWTSTVSLPHFNPTIVVLQMEVLQLLLIVNILSGQYIDYSKLQLLYCRLWIDTREVSLYTYVLTWRMDWQEQLQSSS